jgi:hypothetical protein
MSHDGARAAKAATKLLPLCSDSLGEVDDAGKHVSRRTTRAGRPPAKIVYGHVKYQRKLPRTVVVHQTADRFGANLSVRRHASPLTSCGFLGLSVRQVDDAQKNMRRRATLTCSPPAQIFNLHVKDAREVRVAVVGNHRSDGLHVQLSVDRHANSVRKRYAFAADATGLPAADVVRSGAPLKKFRVDRGNLVRSDAGIFFLPKKKFKGAEIDGLPLAGGG